MLSGRLVICAHPTLRVFAACCGGVARRAQLDGVTFVPLLRFLCPFPLPSAALAMLHGISLCRACRSSCLCITSSTTEQKWRELSKSSAMPRAAMQLSTWAASCPPFLSRPSRAWVYILSSAGAFVDITGGKWSMNSSLSTRILAAGARETKKTPTLDSSQALRTGSQLGNSDAVASVTGHRRFAMRAVCTITPNVTPNTTILFEVSGGWQFLPLLPWLCHFGSSSAVIIRFP